jgi:hypothetical protein
MKKICLAGCALLLAATMSYAQRSTSYYQLLKSKALYNQIQTAYADSLANLVGDFAFKKQNVIISSQRSINPYYYRLFAPVTVYESVVDDALKVNFNAEQELQPVVLTPQRGLVQNDEEIQRGISGALMNVYLNEPTSVKYTDRIVMGQQTFNKDVVKELPRKEQMTDVMVSQQAVDPGKSAELIIKKPNFWKKTGATSLQFTQNYLSDNWYKGGESNNTLLATLELNANYDDQQKLQWDNKLEWKLGFITTRSDSLHKYKTNADLIRLTSKLGLKAFKNWYYTLQGEFYTQFFATYNTNSDVKISDMLSPGYLKVDLGMDYKRSTKTFEVSAVLAPLSYKLTYVRDRDVDETRFSVDEGKRAKHDVGSNIQVNSNWKIASPISWQSRLSYFTTYEKAQAEWENTFNFSVNKYLSTKVFVHVRFDDSVTRTDNDSYFQVMELLSFGLNYSF